MLVAATGCFYAGSVALFSWFWVRGVNRAAVPIQIGIVVLYGTLSLISVSRRPDDLRVRLFTLTGAQVCLSLLLTGFEPVARLSAGYLAWLALRRAVYIAASPLFVHTAAMIPRRNPLLDRYRWFLPGLYAAAAVAALGTWGLGVAAVGGNAAAGNAVGPIFLKTNLVCYTVEGLLGLALLGSAARNEETAHRRGQALVVFLGLAPWTARLLLLLVAPGLLASIPFAAWSEPIVILFVPISFFVAIFGLGLFELPVVVRKSLIYGLTLAGLALAAFVAWVVTATVASRALGVRPTAWNVALVLVALSLLARPLIRRVTHGVDRLFFPEKVALRRLQRVLLAELAPLTDIDRIGEHLVGRLQEALALRSAALLVADEARELYYGRAAVTAAGSGPAPGRAVLHRESLERVPGWESGVAVVPAGAVPPGGARPEEPGSTLRTLGARLLVRIELTGDPVGVLALGATLSGNEFDREDRGELALLARQAAAMLENARLFDMATTDPLTRLLRRNVFEERLAAELARGRRSGDALAVALVDIDRFKAVNDTWGHAAGDAALRLVAGVLRDGRRATDVVARYGGEEFAILFPGTALEQAAALVDRIRADLAATPFEPAPGVRHPITFSAGVCGVTPEDGPAEPAGIMRRADEALYRAKEAGRNRVITAPSGLDR